MEKKEQIKNIILVFSTIMKSMINPSFKITNPEGGVTQQTIGKCLDLLEADFGDAISRERLVDFCVCQAYRGMLHPDEQEPEVLRGQMAGR